MCELRQVLFKFFELRGLDLGTDAQFEVATLLPERPARSEEPDELVLHPDASDQVEDGSQASSEDQDTVFDIRERVARFEKRGKFR